MEKHAYLIVEKGSPYEEGNRVPLKPSKVLIGREWLGKIPDIAFDDPRVSRSHAEISYENGHYVFRDLPSNKHGTEINGKPVMKGICCELKHNDNIVLARGAVVLRFCCQADAGQTQEIGDLVAEIQPSAEEKPLSCECIIVNADRREVLLDGRELRPRIVGREFELLLLLYRNRGKALSHEEIIEWVWRNVPNRDTITRQDVTTLVHRLKGSLGDYKEHVLSVPTYGYMLD